MLWSGSRGQHLSELWQRDLYRAMPRGKESFAKPGLCSREVLQEAGGGLGQNPPTPQRAMICGGGGKRANHPTPPLPVSALLLCKQGVVLGGTYPPAPAHGRPCGVGPSHSSNLPACERCPLADLPAALAARMWRSKAADGTRAAPPILPPPPTAPSDGAGSRTPRSLSHFVPLVLASCYPSPRHVPQWDG